MSEIRKLNLMDTFHVSAILKKIDFNIDPDYVQKITSSTDNEEEAIMLLGQEVLQIVIKNFHLAQNEVFAWIADFKEDLTIEDVKFMPLDEIIAMIKQKFVGADTGAFFKSLLQTEEK